MTYPIVYRNGRFLPIASAGISLLDRAFLYGDGLFETIRVVNGQPNHWHRHIARLERGARFLRIPIHVPADRLLAHALELIRRNDSHDAVLRLTLSRGSGPRGYSPQGATDPLLGMTILPGPNRDGPYPVRWRLVTSHVRVVSEDPLTRFKTCSRLPYVMARMEADDAGANDALLLNTDGHVAESSCANLFWIDNNILHTPPLESGALDGITRALVLEHASRLNIPTREERLTPLRLRDAQGCFLTLTTLGVVGIQSLDGRSVPEHALTSQLQTAVASGQA